MRSSVYPPLRLALPVLLCLCAATRAGLAAAAPKISRARSLEATDTVELNFDKRDLAEVIQFVSELTQRNFILPERLTGKVTLLSNAPVPKGEVWSIFLSALDANGWAVYAVGDYWKVVEKKQSARSGIPLYLEPGAALPEGEQMVTRVLRLRYVEAEPLRSLLGQFLSPNADLQIFPPDLLLISDVALNLRRLERLIAQLDQPGVTDELRLVPVEHAAAAALAQKLNEILQAQQAPGAAKAPPAPRVIAEERTNQLIIVAGAKALARVLDLVRELDVPAGDSGVHVLALENAKAEELASTLQSLAQGLGGKKRTAGAGAAPAGGNGDVFNGEIKVTADKTTNSLVVIASDADYRTLRRVVQQLDLRRNQVFVEAVIMEVNLENDSDVSASLHAGTIFNNVGVGSARGSAPAVIGSELGGLSSLGGVTSLASLSGFLAGIQGPSMTVGGVTLPSLAVLINAMETSSDVNVVSTPHVLITDNSEGEITVGQNVPFQSAYAPATGTSSTTATALSSLTSQYAPIQRQNVELRLHLKAQISAGDNVRLEVDEQTEEIASVDKQLGPTTSKRSAKTTVIARDGATVVLGGLIQERAIKQVSKVPVLGSIPVLGWLFRSETTKRTRTNLLLFLTPYIIRDASDFRSILERKLAERSEFTRRFVSQDDPPRPIDYAGKPGALLRIRRAIDEEMARVENGGAGARGETIVAPRPAQ